VLQVLCEMNKSAPANLILPYTDRVFNICEVASNNTLLTNNTLVRKLRVKLASRTLLRLMPPRRNNKQRKGIAMCPRFESEALTKVWRQSFATE
jgi:tubulin-specific chaperone D